MSHHSFTGIGPKTTNPETVTGCFFYIWALFRISCHLTKMNWQ